MASNAVHFRAPPHISASATSFTPPTNAWMAGTWFVTHSSLPMWKEKQNVRITYTELKDGKLDDLVSSQKLGSPPDAKDSEIKGVDTPDKERPMAFKWRGKGLLMIASSQWEVLGSGTWTEASGDEKQWAVTYFAKTIYTPPGIDVYTRGKEGLSEEALQTVKSGLKEVGASDKDFLSIVESLFEVKRA